MGNMTLAGPGIGWFPDSVIIKAINRSGSTVTYGDHVQMDVTSSAAEVSSPSSTSTLGSTSHPLSNFVAPDAIAHATPPVATIHCGIFGLVIDPAGIANDATGEIMLRGYMDDTDGDGAAVVAATVDGSLLIAATDHILAASTTSADAKIIAIAMEDDGDHAGFAQVVFDGINGFGFAGDA